MPELTNNILETIKKKIGAEADVLGNFDQDLMISINSAFATLRQVGVGPKEGFKIDTDSTWDDYDISSDIDIDMVKDYIYLKVRIIFDPPASSTILQAYTEQIKELEWRLHVFSDKTYKEPIEVIT